MNPILRAVIAHIAARATGASTRSAVYDYSQNEYISLSGSVTAGSVNVHDFTRNVSIVGSLPNLHDFGGNAAITLNVNGIKFDGYDFGSRQFYSGSINGSSVTFYDYETGQYYSFAI